MKRILLPGLLIFYFMVTIECGEEAFRVKGARFRKEEEKTMVINYLIMLGILLVFGMLSYRVYIKNNECKIDKSHIKDIKAEIQHIEAGGEEFLLTSMRDKKDGIVFYPNPALLVEDKKKGALEKLKKSLHRMQKKIKNADKEIGNLEQKNMVFEKQIELLKAEFELKKNEGFDIGAAHGLGEKPLHEYYPTMENEGEMGTEGGLEVDIQMGGDLDVALIPDGEVLVEVEVDLAAEAEMG